MSPTVVAPDAAQTARNYAHSDVLVSTEWVAQHLNDARVRLVEADEDVLLYELGHIPGAVKLDWHIDLQSQVRRDFISQDEFQELMRRNGIANDTTVVFYGDKNNWYATYTFWLFKYYGHEDCRVMDGGRQKWIDENRPLDKAFPSYPETIYSAKPADAKIRAFRDDVMAQITSAHPTLIDVRSPQEYSGEVIHMLGYPQEGAQRGGHVAGAVNIPWSQAANPDGTFKSVSELKQLYGDKGFGPDRATIAYCRIGERSSHTWFVLTYLLGYPDVRNYDGSWTEWGSMVNVPIEKGS